MTRKDFSDLEQMLGEISRQGSHPAPLSAETVKWAEGEIANLEQAVSDVEGSLMLLGAFFQAFTLPQAVVGAMGISVTELRSHLPALKQAAKDAGEDPR